MGHFLFNIVNFCLLFIYLSTYSVLCFTLVFIQGFCGFFYLLWTFLYRYVYRQTFSIIMYIWQSNCWIPSLLSCVYSAPHPLFCVLVFSSLFIVQFFFCMCVGCFLYVWGVGRGGAGGGDQSAQGAMLVYPRDSWGNSAWCLALTCLVCQMTPKQVWSRCLAAQEPSCFVSVTWHGEVLYGLGVQCVKVLILLGALFPQV
jgi:hypothetical protein